MKVKELIEQLEKYFPEDEVEAYPHLTDLHVDLIVGVETVATLKTF